MNNYNILGIVIIVSLLTIVYYFNLNKESFQNNMSECNDINSDYCQAFNENSPECDDAHPSNVSNTCKRTCNKCPDQQQPNELSFSEQEQEPSELNNLDRTDAEDNLLNQSNQNNSMMQNNTMMQNNSMDVSIEEELSTNVPTPYNESINNIYTEETSNNIETINNITYKFNADESLINSFKNTNLRLQFSEQFNIPQNKIKSIDITKGSIFVTVTFTEPIFIDTFEDFFVKINEVTYKGTTNFESVESEIVGPEIGYAGLNIGNNKVQIDNLINMANNSNMNDIQDYLKNFSLKDLMNILKQLMSLNMNSNGMPDLIELLNNMINSKNNSNDYYNSNNSNNFNNVNSVERSNDPRISQKYIKGVGNVFAPKIIISDDNNNI